MSHIMNMLCTQYDIPILLDSRQGVEVVLVDLSKTFYTVNHHLLTKLEALVFKWVATFLRDTR